MAIEQMKKLDIGLELPNAYIRIDTINGYKGGLTLSVNTYVSRESFKNGSSFLDQKSIEFIPSVEEGSENFIKQGYEYLKTMVEYENAKNVPEDGSPD